MKTGDIILITAMMWPVAIFVGCVVAVVIKSNWHSAHHRKERK
jgi:hypothetical protein